MNPPDCIATFAETSALFAVMDDDFPEARRIIADLFPHERKMFSEQLTRLLNMLGEPCQECGDLTPVTLSVTKPVFGPDSRYLCRECAGAAEKSSSADHVIGQTDTPGAIPVVGA